MYERFETFINQIPGIDDKSSSELIDYFVYYSTELCDKRATAGIVSKLFDDASVPPYSNIRAYLSNHSRPKRKGHPKFIKRHDGYELTRSRKRELAETINTEPAKVEVSTALRALVSKLTNPAEKGFLQETNDCYEIGAHRATIVMAWILAVHHLHQHILKHKLKEFNAALAKNTDKRVKITSVSTLDDFSEIPEGKFIEFARQAKIISNDVRKILNAKLDTRNSAAHPSGITVSPVKVTDFVIDLVDNVVLKYPR